MRKQILLAAACLLCMGTGWSQSKKQMNIGGPHGETDFVINWKQYYDYDGWVKIMMDLQKKYPNLCTVESIGKSRMGRDQYVMTITAKNTGKDTDKPAVWVDGAIHGNEVNGITCSLYLAWYLLTRYDYDTRVFESLNRSTIYILPGLNVDAADSYVRYPNTENNPREPFRPVDDDKDGLYDDDLTEDVDADGELSIMYAEDPAGEFRLSKDQMRFIKIGDNDWWEGTRFRRIGNEGYDNDGDGKMAEDDLGGIDPNRNYPFDFRKNLGKSYPLSEPETRNAYMFMKEHKNILVDFNYHNIGRLIMYMMPPKASKPAQRRYYGSRTNEVKDKYALKTDREVDPEYQHDKDVQQRIVSDGLYILKEYTPEPGNEYGETLSSAYYLLGAYSYLIELWEQPVPYADTNEDGYVDEAEYARWVELDLGGDAWVKPHAFDHPQLGKIWVGGTSRKHIGRTPPGRYIEEEASKQCMFVLHCINQLPQLRFTTHTTKKIGTNLYQVEVNVTNDKVYPTASDRSVLLKRYTPDKILASVSSGSLVEPGKSEKTAEETGWFRTNYIKPALAAGKEVEFRMKGQSTETFRYTIATTNPAGTTLSLSLVSPNGGKDKIQIKLN